MSSNLTNQLIWYIRRYAAQMGWIGMAGIGLLAACAMFYLSVLAPLNQSVFQIYSFGMMLPAAAFTASTTYHNPLTVRSK